MTCLVAVRFAPTATGTHTGLLTIYGNVAGGQAAAMLSGVGTAPASIVLTPTSVSFGDENVGSTSAVQNVTLSNTGGTAVMLQPVTIAGEFSISANTCGTTLAASVGCTVSVKFAPTSSGVQNGTLTVVDGVGTQTAELTGTGVNPATDGLAPLSLGFGAQQITTASAAQQLTLTNAGDVALTLISATVTGDFAVVNGCGATLVAHSNCALQVTYVPKNVGAEAGVLTVSDEFRAQTVALTGIGVAPAGVSLAPASGLSFSGIAVGQTSSVQVVTLTNNGGLPLILGGVAASGDFAVAANSCGSSLVSGANCKVSVSFGPMAAGARLGRLTFTDNAATSPQVLALSGVGIDFALAADGPVSETVTSGQTATYLLLLTSVAGVPGDAAFTCSGVQAAARCTVTPSTPSLDAAGGTVITVTMATGVTGAGLEGPGFPWNRPVGWLAVALPLGVAGRRRRRRGWGFLLIVGLLGCTTIGRTIPGGGGGGGSGPPPVTPSGSYTLVVAGSSAGLVRAVDLTLVVQ